MADPIDPRYRKFDGAIRRAAQKYGIAPEVLYGVMHKEARGALQKNDFSPDITGADGHGQGPFQIDDRYHGSFLQANGNGRDVESAADYAAQQLSSNLKSFGGDLRKAVAAYNAGPTGVRRALSTGAKDPDAATTDGRYSKDVLKYGEQFRPEVQHWGLEEDLQASVPRKEPTPEDPHVVPPNLVSSPAPAASMPDEAVAEDEQEPQPQASSGSGAPGLMGLAGLVPQAVMGQTGPSTPEAPALDTETEVQEQVPAATSASVSVSAPPDEAEKTAALEKAIQVGNALAPKEVPMDPRFLGPQLPQNKDDETPFPLGAAETKSYSMPERDWQAELANARTEADKRRALAMMSRGLSGIAQAIGGNKPQTAFWDARDKLANQPLERLGEDQKLDALARKAMAEKAARDPASPESRKAQELFARLSPALARKMTEPVLRGMTKAQLDEITGLDLSEKKQAETARHNQTMEALAGARGAVGVNQHNSNLGSRLQGAIQRWYSEFKPGGSNLQAQIAERQAAGRAFSMMDKRVPTAEQVIQLEQINQIIPGSVRGLHVEGLSPDNFDNFMANHGRGVLTQLGNDPVFQRNKAAFISAVERLRGKMRNELFGATLADNEQAAFEKMWSSRSLEDPAMAAVALDLFRRTLWRKMQQHDRAAEVIFSRLDPTLWPDLEGAGMITYKHPIFSDLNAGAFEQTKPGQSHTFKPAAPKPAAQAPAPSAPTNAPTPGGLIKVKDTQTGDIKSLPPERAEKFLKSSRFQRVE